MLTKITFYEICSLGYSLDEQRVTFPLPFEILPGVTIEDVSSWLNDESLRWVSSYLGIYQTEALKNVRFALVHRYAADSSIRGTDQDVESEKLVRNLAELVHIIRPMRQRTSIVHGEYTEDGTVKIAGMDTPVEIEVPEIHKLNYLHDNDLNSLKELASSFLEGMRGKFSKFRSSVFYYSLGRLMQHGNARYLLWCSAIEALYTSHSLEHQGKLVATERIKWFLGPNTPIYEADDMPDYVVRKSHITVSDIVQKLYELRNYIAHGDVVPKEVFETPMRQGIAGSVAMIEVLVEAASFIARRSILRILSQNLLQHFEGAETAEAYFAAHGLTKRQLKKLRHSRI
jgi:hypothetical protein